MTVKELQSILGDILREFDSICRKEGIQYSLAYGTMLGAVRHKGFIPWDDDIDVFMWKDEYIKLKKCISNSLSENYKFVEPSDMNPYFFDLVPRVVDTRYHWQRRRKATKHITTFKTMSLWIFLFLTEMQKLI